MDKIENHKLNTRTKNLIGKKFEKILVLEFSHYNKRHEAYWKCQCDCGNIKTIRAASLLEKSTKSCGCLRQEIMRRTQKSQHKQYGASAFNSVYAQYKRQAKNRNIQFNLTRDQCKQLFAENCFYCGKPPSNSVRISGIGSRKCNRNGGFVYSGIDRLDNKQGYYLSNVVSCCKDCNRSKATKNKQEFLDWIKQVYEYNYK